MKAFPFSDNDGMYQEGMDLRDYFATHVMQGMVSNSSFETPEQLVRAATVAYMVADAMMQVREDES
jgi:hypothetical protein